MIEIRTGPENTDFDVVHVWLATCYWSPGVSRETVVRAAENSSLVMNAYIYNKQVGYCRAISDAATFAWIADVFVDPNHRGTGIAKHMISAMLGDPNHQGLRRWALATKDASSLYAQFGFEPVDPGRWMVRPQARN